MRFGSEMKSAQTMGWIFDLLRLAIGLIVLFHTYSTKDTTIIIAFLVVVYGMITAQGYAQDAMSASYFLELGKRLRHRMGEMDDASELESVTQREIPIAVRGLVFSLALAIIAGVKLLVIFFLD